MAGNVLWRRIYDVQAQTTITEEDQMGTPTSGYIFPPYLFFSLINIISDHLPPRVLPHMLPVTRMIYKTS